MQSVILTELGISVFEDKKCLEKFPFADPVKDYLEIKKGEANLGKLLGYLSKLESMVQTNDEALMNILKKSIDVQMLSEQEIDEIHSSKPEILVESGFAKDQNDAMSKLRDFAISLSSSKVAESRLELWFETSFNHKGGSSENKYGHGSSAKYN